MCTIRRQTLHPGLACALLIFVSVACGDRATRTDDHLRLDLDRADPRSFISYYFGGLMQPEAADPFESGLVTESSGDFFVNRDRLADVLGDSPLPVDENADGTLDWDELAPFLQSTYYDRRQMPLVFDSVAAGTEDEEWFEVSVDGVMTTATRRIRVPLSAIHAALEGYKERGDRLIYPRGTLIVADHLADEAVIERTIMRKRADGHWDYAVYDSTGVRADSTMTPPKSLVVPTQCAGCHLGSRQYEPEKSFPAPAAPGPAGPRTVHWQGAMPSADLVRHFDEHRKRSDGILGLYGTLYVAELEARRSSGTLSDVESHLLESLGL